MRNIIEKVLSPQAIKLYRLIGARPLTAKELAKKLKIFPNAVYRETKKLIDFGLVGETSSHPSRFYAQNPDFAMGIILASLKHDIFGGPYVYNQPIKINFITTRKQLLNFTDQDVEPARSSVDIIVSGHEVPAETILLQKEAVSRGVGVRIIIQDINASVRERIRAWQRMGIKIRHLKYIRARIFVIDKKIVYFTSYNKNQNNEAVGIRFEYEPYASLMAELFEQKWLQAREIE